MNGQERYNIILSLRLNTACLSGVAKLARRERGEKNTVRASAVENWSTSLRGTSAVVVFAQYFLFFLYNTYIY